MKTLSRAFSLLELMVVLAIIAFLSMLAMPSFVSFFAKAKRTEAYTQLRSLHMAQKAYFTEHNAYTTNLSGPDGLGWKTEGQLYYTYGFSQGSPGKNHVIGSLKSPASALTGSMANDKNFTICAAGDIDNDGEHDILSIDQDGKITIIKDDLA